MYAQTEWGRLVVARLRGEYILMRFLNWLRGCFQSEILAQPLAATILALLFAPFSIYLGFEMNARLSKPVLSIEYVSKYDDKAYVNRVELERKINTIALRARLKFWLVFYVIFLSMSNIR